MHCNGSTKMCWNDSVMGMRCETQSCAEGFQAISAPPRQTCQQQWQQVISTPVLCDAIVWVPMQCFVGVQVRLCQLQEQPPQQQLTLELPPQESRGEHVAHGVPPGRSPTPPARNGAGTPPPAAECEWGPSGGEAPKRGPGPRRGGRATTSDVAADISGSTECADGTVKAHLQALRDENPEAVLVVRRISKLGFAAEDKLRRYFARYGEVKAVRVSHSRVRFTGSDPYWRARGASLGFVVMLSVKATKDVLTEGPEHLVDGVKIRAQAFHKHGPASEEVSSAAGEDGGAEVEVALTDCTGQ